MTLRMPLETVGLVGFHEHAFFCSCAYGCCPNPEYACFLSDPEDEAETEGACTGVVRAVDGDTIELEDGRKVRYIGINVRRRLIRVGGSNVLGKEVSLQIGI